MVQNGKGKSIAVKRLANCTTTLFAAYPPRFRAQIKLVSSWRWRQEMCVCGTLRMCINTPNPEPFNRRLNEVNTHYLKVRGCNCVTIF